MPLVLAQCLWLSLPVVLAGILHMVVVKKGWLATLKRPVDFGLSLGGERIFGDNKTWRGFVVMIALSATLGAAQGLLWGEWAQASSGPSPFDAYEIAQRFGLAHSQGPPRFTFTIGELSRLLDSWDFAKVYALVSAVAGLGYALGELPNSFLKRRVKIQPGKTGSGALGLFFFVLDQADSVIAALGLVALVFGVSLAVFLAGVVTLTLVHLALNATLYFLRVRKNL